LEMSCFVVNEMFISRTFVWDGVHGNNFRLKPLDPAPCENRIVLLIQSLLFGIHLQNHEEKCARVLCERTGCWICTADWLSNMFGRIRRSTVSYVNTITQEVDFLKEPIAPTLTADRVHRNVLVLGFSDEKSAVYSSIPSFRRFPINPINCGFSMTTRDNF
jgi:hypothetical protein